MFATYGNYTHSVENGNAVNLERMEIIPDYGPRGRKLSVTHRLHLQGVLLADNQADISTKIAALVDAYADNGKDWILHQSDGTPTRHKLLQNASGAMTDVQVEYRSWPVGEPAEYATGRTFSIIMRQTLQDLESEILEYWETIRYSGYGGFLPNYIPDQTFSLLCNYKRKLVHFPLQPPIVQNVYVSTGLQLVQRGKVVAMNGWPNAYVPYPYYPNYLTHTSINNLEPTWTGRSYTHYGIEWTYQFELPAFALPITTLPGW
jgi:hypothetical protein